MQLLYKKDVLSPANIAIPYIIYNIPIDRTKICVEGS